jgi:hypothetical protein
MGVLDNNEAVTNLSLQERVARKIKNQTKSSFGTLCGIFNDGAKLFWQNDRAKPSEIAAALGSDAKEIFELHAKLGALISSINPQGISQGLSVIGQFTMNDDGTVTVVEPSPENK